MTRTRLGVFAATALLCAACGVLADDLQDQTLKEVAGYREWTRLTEKPIQFDISFESIAG